MFPEQYDLLLWLAQAALHKHHTAINPRHQLQTSTHTINTALMTYPNLSLWTQCGMSSGPHPSHIRDFIVIKSLMLDSINILSSHKNQQCPPNKSKVWYVNEMKLKSETGTLDVELMGSFEPTGCLHRPGNPGCHFCSCHPWCWSSWSLQSVSHQYKFRTCFDV